MKHSYHIPYVLILLLSASITHAQTTTVDTTAPVPSIDFNTSIKDANTVLQQADRVTTLQSQINEHHNQIQQINKEISAYQKQLDATVNKKKTLQNFLSQISLSIKKTGAVISATHEKISATNLELQQLNNGINATQRQIQVDRDGLSQSVRSLRQLESGSLAAQALSNITLSDVWRDSDRATFLHGAIATHVKQLSDEQDRLSTMQHSAENKKSDLVSQQTELQTQQGSLSAAKDTQSTLLSKTQKQESAYQKLIALKKEQEQEFESSLNDLQTKLQVAISEADITKAGAGILQWPVDHVVITQFFGNTAFAAGGAYNGKGHNGIDLGVHIGSPIRAALSGTVLGTGNTDSISGCYSFGKWVMVKHTNGLNTMYAHLSQIRVAAGDPVSTGDLLGYSGDTGYATGPHLHFGVYVSSATKIIRLGDATQHTSACSGAVMPVVPIAGYLNPLNYLPKSR